MRFESRRKTMGALWVLYGVLCFIEVAWLVVQSDQLTLMWGALLNRVANPFAWMTFFHFALVIAVAVVVLAGVFALLAGSALLTQSRSRRNMAVVAGFFGLVTGPLGLILGVYTLISLLPRVADDRYDRLAAAA
ncbi:MAG TPA: hypothetical protein VMD77_11315 [Candidatus Baltobacteraceae bacterium]|nr:hypothetical protein [Candidatus Baltobacteraceae bacterium]